MKFLIFLLLAALIAAEPPKCHECVDFPDDSSEELTVNRTEWLTAECVCENGDFEKEVIEIDENLSVYCCVHEKRLQFFFGRAWKRIRSFFKLIGEIVG
jgi:hypothetical protein